MAKRLIKTSVVVIMTLVLVLGQAVVLSNPQHVEAKKKVTWVYVVPKGKVYHKTPHCRTLSRSKTIYKIKLSEAKKTRRACKVCY